MADNPSAEPASTISSPPISPTPAPAAAAAVTLTTSTSTIPNTTPAGTTPMTPRKHASRRFSQRRVRSNSAFNTLGSGHSDPHHDALNKIKQFLKGRSAFDVFPLSYRFIIFDTKLTVKHALATMHQHGIVSAPLYDSKQWKFAGMLTLIDIIHLIQFYYLKAETFDSAIADVETFKIESLRNIEKELNVPPPPLYSIHPSRPLYEACKFLIQSHARRLPLIDRDSESELELIASVLTQYRVLKFVSTNCAKEISSLNYSLRSLGIGTYVDPKPPAGNDNPYYPIATASMESTVFNVVNLFSERGISAVPILDENGVVLNIYEALDVTTLIRSGAYTKLDLSIRSALQQRTSDFTGVVTCSGTDSLGKLLEFISLQRVHRLIVVDSEGKLSGIITLSDILKYLIKDAPHYSHSTSVNGAVTTSASQNPLPPQAESAREAEE
ncbi:AMP-activated serine/threonine-protein kinase regulatory subunit [Serendipita sp. 399]|nr:AMP-activated serine/threonine-protein kinase regulatory subunit [Serendipita sp. 399]